MDILNALVAFLNFVFIPGLAYGTQLAIGALGVTLVFSILRFSNFAHGDTMAFGTMWSILITWWFQSMGIGLGPLPTALLAIPFAIIITSAMLLGTDKLVYSFYRKQKVAPIILVIVSAGVMFIMNGLVRLIIGVEEQSFADGARFVVAAADFKAWSGLNEGLAIKTTTAVTLITAIVTVALSSSAIVFVAITVAPSVANPEVTLVKVTVNVSEGSTMASFNTGIVMVAVVAPAGIVTVPDSAV